MGNLEQEDMLRRLSAAVGAWEIGIFEHDYASGETWASSRFREMLGFGLEEFVSMNEVARLSFPADVPMIQSAMQAVYDPDGDGLFDLVYRIVRPDGEVRWVHGRGATHFSEFEGKRIPIKTTGTILDVTQQYELRLAVERQEHRLTQAMTTSQVGVFDWDHDPARPEEAVYWSPTYRMICGFDPDAVPDFDWYLKRIHTDDIARFDAATKEALDPKLKGAFDLEYRWFHPNGEMRWCLVRSTTTFHKKGDKVLPRRTVGAVLDITSTKLAAEELAQRSAILEATVDMVCIIDPGLRLLFLNQAGRGLAGFHENQDITGCSLAQLVGLGFEELFLSEGRAAALSVGSWQVETDVIDSLGRARPVSALVLSHRNKNELLTQFSLVVRDLSSERQLEAQFRQSQKMDAIGKLAGGVAHDFNNLLSVILGFSELLEHKLEPGCDGRDDIKEIRLAVDRAAALTRQLLAFSRKELVRPRVLNINQVVQTAGPMFMRLVDASIRLVLTTSKSPAHTKADSHQIEQVLLNLVVNARDAMPRGGELNIEVGHEVLDSRTSLSHLGLAPGLYVVISVTDTGHGMSEDVQEKIFDPFFTTKKQGKGTGLGLSTVFGIVQQSGGAIWLHSEVDRGTTFKIYLPSTDEQPEAAAAPLSTEGKRSEEGTILLVEDESQLREVLFKVLVRAGYKVLTAAGPVEALGLAKEFKGNIELLITDVVLPQMSGPQLATELKKKRRDLLVLFMSGYTEDAMVRNGVINAQFHFLAKPIASVSLLTSVAQLIMSRRMQAV